MTAMHRPRAASTPPGSVVSTDTGDPQLRDRVRVCTRQSRAMSRHCHVTQ